MKLFNELLKNNLSIRKLNRAIILLIKKCQDPDFIQQYRPISLLNCRE